MIINTGKINAKNLITTVEALKCIYDAVRIVDPVQDTVVDITQRLADVCVQGEGDACYAFWKRGQVCANCISLRTVTERDTFFKFEVVDGHVYLVVASPVEYQGDVYAIELLTDITGKGVIENIAGKDAKDIDGFVMRLNDVLARDEKLKEICIQNNAKLAQARRIINKIFERNLSSDAVLLEIAVNEAINNGLRASGKVDLKIRRAGQRLIIRVKDYGTGFSATEVNAKLKKLIDDGDFSAEFDEIQLAEGGRGILLMKMLCDRVVYNAKGNEVLMMKRI